MRRARPIRFLAALFLASALTVALAVLFAQTPPGRALVAHLAGAALSDEEVTVEIDGLTGWLPVTAAARSMTFSDASGTFARAQDVTLDWRPAALLAGQIRIDSLTARRVEIARSPQAAVRESKGFPLLPIGLRIERLAVDTIALGPDVAGTRADLAASAGLIVTAQSAEAELDIRRLDAPGALTAHAAYSAREDRLDLHLTAQEPSGGVLAGLLRMEDQPALEGRLQGTGRLDDWRGEVAVEAAGRQIFGGEARVLAASEGRRLTAALAGEFGRIAPPDLRGALAGQARLDVDVEFGAGHVRVHTATLQSETLDGEVSGHFDVGAGSGAIAAHLILFRPDGAPVALPLHSSVRHLEMGAHLEGRRWAFALEGAGLETAHASLDTLSMRATGRLEGAEIMVKQARLAADGMEAGFTGTLTRAALDGSMTLSLPDLGRLTALLDQPLSGSAEGAAEGRYEFAAARGEARLRGHLRQAATGVPAVDALLAGEVSVSGRLALAGPTVELTHMALESRLAKGSLDGRVTPDTIDVTAGLVVADLGALDMRLGGTGRLRAEIAGNAAAPTVSLVLEGETATAFGQPLRGARMSFAGEPSNTGLIGAINASLALAGLDVTGSARLHSKDGHHRLDGIALRSGAARASGELALAPGAPAAGQIELDVPDLALFAPLVAGNLRGVLEGVLRLNGNGARQGLTAELRGADIAFDDIAIEAATLTAELADVLATPLPAGRLSATGIRIGRTELARLSAQATPAGNRLGLEVAARIDATDIEAAGSAALAPRGLELTVDRAAALGGGIDTSADGPVRLLFDEQGALFERAAIGFGDGRVVVTGRAGKALDLNVEVVEVAAGALTFAMPELAPQGRISGKVRVTGAADAPKLAWQASWRGASVAPFRTAGAGALNAEASGSFDGARMALDGRLSGQPGLDLRVKGGMDAGPAPGLDLLVTGSAPLALAAVAQERGTRLGGALAVDLAVKGDPSNPAVTGSLTGDDLQVSDPPTGIVLREGRLRTRLAGDRLVIEEARARIAEEGRLVLSGTVGLDAAAGLVSDLALKVEQGRLADGDLVTAIFNADVTAKGPLLDNLNVAGRIDIQRMDVNVREVDPQVTAAIDVQHRNAPPDLARANAPAQPRRQGGGAAGARLDLQVSAPARVFVRGRGLDAELGGELRLTGPSDSPAAQGQFTLRRGTLDILGRRLTFDSGRLEFAGDLDPYLNFIATTDAADVTVTVTVTGRASNPQFAFTSVPDLPQDEVLSRFLFGRDLARLSPLQIAQLADSLATLGGYGEGGIMSRLRDQLGVDSLDVRTTDTGGAEVSVRRYISDNVNVGVTQGTTPDSSRVTIELDLLDNLKARGEAGADGAGKGGIFFERRY